MAGSWERPRTASASGAVAMLVVVLAAVGVWLLSGRDPGTSTSGSEPSAAASSADSSAGDSLAEVSLAELPPQADDTVRLIDAGGPYPYEQDDSVFRNNEGLLPDRERGWYHEYTVPTPGERDRGARRIVAGDDGELWWTADHYRSFARILR